MGIRSRSAVAAVLAAPLLLGGCALLGSQAGGTFASIGDAPDCTF